jgi:UDP-glucose 4-epimerase
MRRILVTGARSPLGRSVVDALRASPEVETVRAVESRPARRERDEDDPVDDVEVVSFVPDHRPLADYLERERIEIVIQCGLVADRNGLASHAREADVIGTMCTGAAIGYEGSPVRSWVLASSSAVYPIDSRASLLQGERHELPREEETLAASIVEAEDYARDVAYRHPHVSVAILRLQQLVGPEVEGPLASLLARDPVPSPIGFDPTIQLLHLDDAAASLVFAALGELAGLYNVASAGLIHWEDALRAARRDPTSVLPVGVSLAEPLLERLGLPFVPADLLDLLRYGHVVDTRKIEQAGWKPRYDQPACLASLAREGSRD